MTNPTLKAKKSLVREEIKLEKVKLAKEKQIRKIKPVHRLSMKTILKKQPQATLRIKSNPIAEYKSRFFKS